MRIPDGSWLGIEPRAARHDGWGVSDRLWHGARPFDTRHAPLTIFAALDYAQIDGIPPLAQPACLPSGGGTAVLNLIAGLAHDQGATRLRYRGPYATEQLFLALLESFHYDSRATDPFARFMAGELDWRPAPYERTFERDGVYVQLRHRVEKVVWRGRTYYRPDWQGIARQTPRRVYDTLEGVRCSLWALGTAVEDHVRLSRDGDLVATLGVRADSESPRPISPTIVRGIFAIVAAQSAPALGRTIRDSADQFSFEWGPVDRDLIAIAGNGARVSSALRRLVAGRLSAARTAADRLALTLAALTEMAGLAGDELRARAEQQILDAPTATQAEVVRDRAGSDPLPDETTGPAIARALEALVAEAASGDRVNDQHDIERNEDADRNR